MLPQYHRLSVTTLEKFRRYLDGASSYDTEEALLDVLRGLFMGNAYTDIGEAFHWMIENPGIGMRLSLPSGSYIVSPKGIALPEDVANRALEYRAAHPHMLCEFKMGGMYELPEGRGVFLSGKLDALEGTIVRDTKVKFRRLSDVHEYLDSLQWRVYLESLGANTFYYDIFELIGFDQWPGHTSIFIDGRPRNIAIIDGVSMRPVEEISCFRYPGMREDIIRTIRAFHDWIELRGVAHLLKPCGPDGTPLNHYQKTGGR